MKRSCARPSPGEKSRHGPVHPTPLQTPPALSAVVSRPLLLRLPAAVLSLVWNFVPPRDAVLAQRLSKALHRCAREALGTRRHLHIVVGEAGDEESPAATEPPATFLALCTGVAHVDLAYRRSDATVDAWLDGWLARWASTLQSLRVNRDPPFVARRTWRPKALVACARLRRLSADCLCPSAARRAVLALGEGAEGFPDINLREFSVDRLSAGADRALLDVLLERGPGSWHANALVVDRSQFLMSGDAAATAELVRALAFPAVEVRLPADAWGEPPLARFLQGVTEGRPAVIEDRPGGLVLHPARKAVRPFVLSTEDGPALSTEDGPALSTEDCPALRHVLAPLRELTLVHVSPYFRAALQWPAPAFDAPRLQKLTLDLILPVSPRGACSLHTLPALRHLVLRRVFRDIGDAVALVKWLGCGAQLRSLTLRRLAPDAEADPHATTAAAVAAAAPGTLAELAAATPALTFLDTNVLMTDGARGAVIGQCAAVWPHVRTLRCWLSHADRRLEAYLAAWPLVDSFRISAGNSLTTYGWPSEKKVESMPPSGARELTVGGCWIYNAPHMPQLHTLRWHAGGEFTWVNLRTLLRRAPALTELEWSSCWPVSKYGGNLESDAPDAFPNVHSLKVTMPEETSDCGRYWGLVDLLPAFTGLRTLRLENFDERLLNALDVVRTHAPSLSSLTIGFNPETEKLDVERGRAVVKAVFPLLQLTWL